MGKIKTSILKAVSNNPIQGLIFSLFGRRLTFNHITIRTISFFLRQRLPFHNLTIDVSDNVVTPMTKALIYWGSYEKNEITLIQKYLGEHDDVIELGSSIGVVSSIISQKQKSGKYISIEANPALININKKNLALNRENGYVLFNNALAYDHKTVAFSPSVNTLAGKLSDQSTSDRAIEIETITLSDICNTYQVNNYTLISDIEGAEILFLINDAAALMSCKTMIIELHDTEYKGTTYLITDLVELIKNRGFKLLDNIGNVYAFQNNNL